MQIVKKVPPDSTQLIIKNLLSLSFSLTIYNKKNFNRKNEILNIQQQPDLNSIILELNVDFQSTS